jgi:hypothetical protein
MSDHPLDGLFDLVSELEQHTLCADPFREDQVRTAEWLRNKAFNGLVNARSRALALDLRDKIEFTTYREWLDALCLEAGKLLGFPSGTRYKGDPILNERLFTQLNAVHHALGKLADLRASLAEKAASPENACGAGQGGRDVAGRNRGGAEHPEETKDLTKAPLLPEPRSVAERAERRAKRDEWFRSFFPDPQSPLERECVAAEVAERLAKRAEWFRPVLFDSSSPLEREYVQEINELYGHLKPGNEDVSEWAKGMIVHHLREILLRAHRWLDANGFTGQPGWNNEPEDERWGFRANDHLSHLLKFLRSSRDRDKRQALTVTDQGETEQGEGEVGPPKKAGKGDDLDHLPPSRKKAYGQYLWAMKQHGALKGATDRQVYDWLEENIESDEKLPTFANWSRYLRDARRANDANKHKSRVGRSGRSIVRPDEI